jgi:preprotein translocase subunit Sss1
MRTGFKEYGLVIWGLEPYTEPEQNTATNILDIIQEFGPLKFSALYERYNQKFPNRQLSESGLRIYLGKLKDKIHKPSKDEYQVLNNSSMYFQSEQQQKQHTEYIHNLKMILNKISTPSHVDYIASIYQSMFPYQNKQHAEIRHTLYNEIKEFKSYGNEVFGLPEWNGSNE